MRTRSHGPAGLPLPPATRVPLSAPPAASTLPTPARLAASPTFPVGGRPLPLLAAWWATRRRIRPPFNSREDPASLKRSTSPPLSSIPSSPYGVSVNPQFLPLLTSPPRVVNPSTSSAVAPPPNSAAAPSPPPALSSMAPKATVSSSSTAPSTPSPSPRPTLKTTTPSPLATTQLLPEAEPPALPPGPRPSRSWVSASPRCPWSGDRSPAVLRSLLQPECLIVAIESGSTMGHSHVVSRRYFQTDHAPVFLSILFSLYP